MAIHVNSSSPIYAPARKTGPLGDQRIRLLIADDIALVRGRLRRMCEAESDFLVAGEASDGLQTVQLAEELKPDIVLMDADMPQLGCAETIRGILAALPETGVIVLTTEQAEESVVEALQAGARAHFPKSVEAATLAQAIRGVYEGQAQIDSQMTLRVLEPLRKGGAGNGMGEKRYRYYE